MPIVDAVQAQLKDAMLARDKERTNALRNIKAALLLIAATLHATLKLLGAARRPFVATTRVLAFAAGTQLFLIVPVLGTLLALVWSAVLTVVGLREVQQTSTARALVALLIPTVLLGIAVTLMMALVRALGISAL